MIKRAIFLFALLCLAVPCVAQADETVKLKDLLDEAMAKSPELASLRSRYEAAFEKVPQAGAFEDPMFGIGFQSLPIDTFSFDRDPMTGKMFELSQALPFFGKRALRREAAYQEATALKHEYSERMFMHHAEMKKVYYELYAIKKGLEIVDKNMALMDVIKKTAEARYSVGTGLFKDVVKAQVEIAMLTEKRLDLQKEDRTKRAYLGSLIGRDEPVTGQVEDIVPEPFKPDKEALLATAMQSKPALGAAASRVKEGSAKVDLARKEYYPDFNVKVSYMSRETLENGMDQPDMLSAMLSMNLPVWWKSKQGPMVREAALERSMAESERDMIVKGIYYKVDSLLNEIGQAERIIKLYKDVVIPQATEDLNSGLAGYEVGKLDFVTLLDSRRTLYEYELSYYNMLAQHEKTIAELEAEVGANLK